VTIERSRAAAAARTNAAWAIELEDEARRLHEPEAAAWRAFWRALVLAPSVEILEALLRGEGVPLDRLDAEWVQRLGRRTP